MSLEETLDGTHQDTTLTDEIRVDFLVEGGLIQVSGTNTDTKGNGALLSLAGGILENSEGRVDTATFLEKTTDSEARTLGGDQDNVNIYMMNVNWLDMGSERFYLQKHDTLFTLGRNDTGLIFVDNGKTVGEIKGLAGSQERSHLGPDGLLVGIRKQVHDNGGLLSGVQDGEQVLSRNPSFFNSLLESLTLTLPNDNVNTIVTEVKSLTTTLRTITKDSNGIVLESLKKLFTGNVRSLVNGLLGTAKVKSLVATDLLGNLQIEW